MKKKFLNTKNVVIGLVSLVLIGASATGVTIFLKDRGEAAAAEQKQVQNLPATGREENNNQTDENTTIPSENNTTGDNTQIPTEPSTTEGATPSETTRPGTTGTTRPRTEEAVAGIEETVRIEERKVFEDLKLSWTTLAIPAITADMGIFKPVLGIEKTATAVVRANQEEQIPVTENNLPIVRVGDTIIYTIKVSNSGNYKATNVVVTDSLDVIFDGQTVKANEELAKIETLDAGKQATLKVGYVVTQDDIDDLENLNIINVATATDGKTTVEDEDDTIEKEQIEDYEINKKSELIKKEGNKDEKAEIGDKILYTITVKNTGTVTLKNILVADEMLEIEEKIDVLEVNETKTLTETYEVTKTDIDRALENEGIITNIAIATYTKEDEIVLEKEDEANAEIKMEYNYTVEYYYDGEKDTTKTDTIEATYQDVISTYTDKNITGYKLEKTENLPLTVSEVETNNVIKVYYVKDNFNYTVEYYYDGEKDTTKTDTIEATYQDVISTYTDKNITGYKLEKAENLPLTVSEVEANNVIKVYYVKRTDLSYTIEYYYQSLDNEAEYNHDENENSKVGDVAYQTEIKLVDIETYKNEHEIAGYVFDENKTEEEGTLPLKVSTDESENVIKLYYKRNSFKYTVEHYTEKLDCTWEYKEKDEYANVKFGTPATYNSKEYQGFTFDDSKTENKNETVPANNDLVIKLYYTRNTYNYTVNFFIEGENEPFETYTKSAKIGETITVSEEEINNTNKDPEIYEYKPGNTSVVIKDGENVINIYYKEIIKVANITETSTAIRKTNLVLVLDLSSSMENGTTRLADAKTATKNFIDQIYSSSAVSGVNIKVITFNTRNPIKEYKGITRCENEEHWEYWLFGIPVHKDETDCKEINGEWYSEYEEGFAAYSGTQVLSVSGLTNNTVTNYAEAQVLKTAIDGIYIPEEYCYGGYGTHIYAALQKANTELTALKNAYGENDNVLVFLSDGKPTESNSEEYSDNTVYNISSEASKITATKYCIRLGEEAQGSTVFNTIATSSDKILDADTEGDLIDGFNAITSSENSRTFTSNNSVNGIITITDVDLNIGIEKPLIVTKPDGTVATYTSIEEINASGFVEYAEKTITWDVRKYSKEATLNISYNIK